MRLMDLEPKDCATVTEILTGRRATSRLEEKGVKVGVIFNVTSKSPTGPIKIKVESTELMIGFELADKIIVKKSICN
jgi:Fe2+ transport system protein FeoA